MYIYTYIYIQYIFETSAIWSDYFSGLPNLYKEEEVLA